MTVKSRVRLPGDIIFRLRLHQSTPWLNRQWGSNAYAQISNNTRSKLIPDTYFRTHFWLGLYLLRNLSEEGPWKQAQLISCTQEAPQLKTRITYDKFSTYPAWVPSSIFVWNSQGAVFYAHQSERLWFAGCRLIFYFSQKNRYFWKKKQLAVSGRTSFILTRILDF